MPRGGHNGARSGGAVAFAAPTAAIVALALLCPAGLGGAEPTAGAPTADDPGGTVVIRLSNRLPSVGPAVSQQDFERALEDTPAHRDSAERMAAVLAGEVSLFDASRLRGQARIDFLEQAARRGDAPAAAAIGDMLDNGDGVPEDPDRAFSYLRAGAIGGRMDAAHSLGGDYAKGRGVRLDFTEALAWLIVAQRRGDRSGAEAQLRQFLEARGRSATITAAEQRVETLQTKVAPEQVAAALPAPAAMVFDEARAIVVGDERNLVEGVEAATDPAAPPVVVMTVLGNRRTWPTLAALERAANQGDPAAMGALGRVLTNGKLLPPDPLRAAVWLERSAAQGDVDAAQQLGDLYSRNEGLAADDAKAFGYFLQAAKGGSPLAIASVGICYTNGRGTERDYVAGLAWLILAKNHGVDLGQESRLRSFLTQHSPEVVAKAEALAVKLMRESERKN